MFWAITIKEFERGLEYRRGRFTGVLGPGRYRIWAFSGREIEPVDVRETALQITGQEVLTTDRVPVWLNVLVRFRIADPARAVHEVDSYLDALHQVVQLAVREAVAGRSVEEVMADRAAMSGDLTVMAGAKAREYGVEVAQVAVKDVILDAELKAVYRAKLTAEQKGQAALIEARHQVAAARAQANAARIVADNPAILAQRQVEVLARAAENGYGNHFVVVPEAVADLARKLADR